MSRKRIRTLLLIAALAMILFFTLQNPKALRDLSDTVRIWLNSIGINVEYKALRSNIHIFEYFLFGLALIEFGRCRGWGSLWMIVTGCTIGIVDEGIKVLLPGREFGMGDLIRDWIGILLAAAVLMVVKKSLKGNG